MIRHHTRVRRAVYFGAFVVGLAVVAEACGPDIVLRAYLNRLSWAPTWRTLTELVTLPPEKSDYSPFAGISTSDGSLDLEKVRGSYQLLFSPPLFSGSFDWPAPAIDNVRDVARTAVVPPAEADELELVRCKVELRGSSPGDKAALDQVASCLESYLARPRLAAFASEARGWLARAYFLRGKQAQAAKIYLAELASATSNIRRERLLTSLQMIQPNLDELDQYFDTPQHALFAANRITNSTYLEPMAAPLITGLEQHANLFAQGAESNALAIALMRASIRAGAPAATLRYAERIPRDSSIRKSGEYNWLVGIAHYQEKNYSAAEPALKNVLNSTDATQEHKSSALTGLIGVYARLKRPVDQLRAAFEAGDFDAPYLLDAEMTLPELEEYLKRFGKARDFTFTEYPRKRSSLETVRYAIAVRHARREEYAEAAQIFDQLQSPRAARVREASKLFEATKSSAGERQLQALYDYADFLAKNEDKIFFNDIIWNQLQTWGFMYPNPDSPEFSSHKYGLTEEGVDRFAQLERRLRDDQEEYWRAYQILNQVVEKTGPSPLGKTAAQRAIFCLRHIRTDRFGRSKEIQAADLRLSDWLKG